MGDSLGMRDMTKMARTVLNLTGGNADGAGAANITSGSPNTENKWVVTTISLVDRTNATGPLRIQLQRAPSLYFIAGAASSATLIGLTHHGWIVMNQGDAIYGSVTVATSGDVIELALFGWGVLTEE